MARNGLFPNTKYKVFVYGIDAKGMLTFCPWPRGMGRNSGILQSGQAMVFAMLVGLAADMATPATCAGITGLTPGLKEAAVCMDGGRL
jgi:hypothetical protein